MTPRMTGSQRQKQSARLGVPREKGTSRLVKVALRAELHRVGDTWVRGPKQ